jgi:hypothetical protein
VQTLKEAQAQLGQSKMFTTLEICTIPIPQTQRKAVEKPFEFGDQR